MTTPEPHSGNGRAAAQRDPRFRLVGLAELGRLAATEPDGYLVEGILPAHGVALVVGKPRARKTTMLASMTIAIAAGQSWAGRKTLQGPVIWVHEDRGGIAHLAALAGLAANACGVDPLGKLPWHLLSPRGFSVDDDEDIAILGRLADEIGAVAVVVDCFRGATAADENRSGETRVVMRRLDTLADGQRLVVMTHHLGRAGGVRGSTDLEAGAESTIRVSASGERIQVVAEHHRWATVRVTLREERTNDLLRYVVAGDAGPDSTLCLSILQVLRGDGPLSKRGIRTALRKAGVRARNESIDTALDELVDDEDVARDGQGSRQVYRLPP